MTARIDITPETKVGALLDVWPELEEVLLAASPAFSKLRNPVLRRTVARVASLRQAAAVGGLSVGELVNRLRAAAGLAGIETVENANDEGPAPDWVSGDRPERVMDVRVVIDRGEQPLGEVLAALRALPGGGVLKLVTPFPPAPLVEQARLAGFVSWSRATGPGAVETFFRRRD